MILVISVTFRFSTKSTSEKIVYNGRHDGDNDAALSNPVKAHRATYPSGNPSCYDACFLL